jgi:hypothetical protein
LDISTFGSPRYAIGNGIHLDCTVMWNIVATGTKLWRTQDKKKRDTEPAEAPGELATSPDNGVTNIEWSYPRWLWKP